MPERERETDSRALENGVVGAVFISHDADRAGTSALMRDEIQSFFSIIQRYECKPDCPDKE